MTERTKVRAPRSPGRRISREEALVQYRYGSLRILRDGRVRLSARTIPDVPELDFSAQYGTEIGNGTYVDDRANYSIYARWPGNSSFFILYVTRHRVTSACFDFRLSPDELHRAVALLRGAGGGIERWIAPGLEWTQRSLAGGGSKHPETVTVIPKLLESVRDLPRAVPPLGTETLQRSPRRSPRTGRGGKHAR